MGTNTSRIAVVVALAMTPLAWSPPVGAQSDAGSAAVHAERIIVQVSENDPKRWGLALNNIRNLQAALGADKVDITLVAFGPGIDMLKDDSIVAERVSGAVDAGVHVVACENTMANRHIDKDAMHPKIGYVPSGVVAIVDRQRQGWSYLRP